ncbi:hypothetical protein EVG20_g9680 [Dentipellis fragilis]|uniref:Uncharacterized protein n=1 Tax=Dentipellis fragilis TaxID=205917 RepID=A0A4Y9XYQ6_9AGAM|nr:hypothetical protein EVG20_g9680 [Dentipellis fragilis]
MSNISTIPTLPPSPTTEVDTPAAVKVSDDKVLKGALVEVAPGASVLMHFADNIAHEELISKIREAWHLGLDKIMAWALSFEDADPFAIGSLSSCFNVPTKHHRSYIALDIDDIPNLSEIISDLIVIAVQEGMDIVNAACMVIGIAADFWPQMIRRRAAVTRGKNDVQRAKLEIALELVYVATANRSNRRAHRDDEDEHSMSDEDREKALSAGEVVFEVANVEVHLRI